MRSIGSYLTKEVAAAGWSAFGAGGIVRSELSGREKVYFSGINSAKGLFSRHADA